ncbi:MULTISPECIES: hypothetical protein [Atopobiaceae]|uniref:hypothetical protein n=1 Tax=Atopobiaceae TaxID=1643824 RepID=UPI000B393750|nr:MULTISPECIES: hypothetical protein [Atopobiaceae]MCR8908669.1 hypothetical protein [Thermophilibacter sp. ET337]OUO31659.1 hypothetical protein B5F85_09695 [Olsenella sp. An293]
MKRREFLLALLCAIYLAVLPGCSDNELTVGGENGPISHNERALVLSVDEESQTAEVRILERPDGLTLTWGTHPAGAEGTADFSEWGSSGLPEVGDDVILKWIGIPAEESSFPILVNSWEPTVSFYEALGDAHEVRLPASMLRFFSQTAEELVADFAESPELALEACAEGEDLVLTFTGKQLADYRSDVEQSLDESVASLLESEDVDAVEVADDNASVTITASPALLDKPLLVGQAFMAVPGMCATLQALDGTTDWHVEVAVIDAEKSVEVAPVTLPDESVTITAESWAEAVAE